MVEVLVSLAISATALLALAGVHAASVRYSKMSQYRAVATMLANDLAERMRANKGDATPAGNGFLGGGYDFTNTWAAQQDSTNTAAFPPTSLPGDCASQASSCTGVEMATLNLRQWRYLVRQHLPSGSVYLASVTLPGFTVPYAMDLWVAWRDPALRNTDESNLNNNECPAALSKDSAEDANAIRCIYFRINV